MEREISVYQPNSDWEISPGTLHLADALGLRHPRVRKDGVAAAWVMSTDIVVTLRHPSGQHELLAICVKHDDELTRPRTIELLRIEREYWKCQGAFWLLLSPSLYSARVADTVRIGMPWAVDPSPLARTLLEKAAAGMESLRGLPFVEAVRAIQRDICCDGETAQHILWQAIWEGLIPLDMSKPIRPQAPLELLSKSAFWQQNPIVSRRTAWRY